MGQSGGLSEFSPWAGISIFSLKTSGQAHGGEDGSGKGTQNPLNDQMKSMTAFILHMKKK